MTKCSETTQRRTVNGCKRKRLWPNTSHYPSTCQERLKNTKKTFQDGQSLGQHALGTSLTRSTNAISALFVLSSQELTVRRKWNPSPPSTLP